MVKFMEFENVEEPTSADLADDLKIINSDLPPEREDLKQSPFTTKPTRKPAFKPKPPVIEETIEEEPQEEEYNEEEQEEEDLEPPKPKVKALKPKKPLSEKQKAHLEKCRIKKLEKAKGKVEKTLQKNNIVNKIALPQQEEKTDEELMNMDNAEFERWMKNMDRFDKMLKAIKKDEERKQQEALKQEQEIENRIRKKIEMENKEKQGIRTTTEAKVPILQQPVQPIEEQPQYGQYSSMFGY